MWEVVSVRCPSRAMFEALFRGHLCAIRVPGFVSKDMCSVALRSIQAHGMERYQNIDPPIRKIGITQYEHMGSPELKREYFRKATAANATRLAIFEETGDLLERVISAVGQVWGRAGLAVEKETHEPYFAGLIRDIPIALLHRDWAPKDAQGWSIGEVQAQLTWNIYLQMGKVGGELVIYRRRYEESDEAQKAMPNNCAYNSCMVDGRESVAIVPEQGELLLFDSRNYHEVKRTPGTTSRVTASSFIGLSPEQDLIFWS
jgi:hypothetical protein